MIIIGAGMAGLLAANMLRRHKPVIWESQSSLPNNHHALLRFRTDSVARALGIPFKKVRVTKSIFLDGKHYDRASLMLNNMYSFKVLGHYRARSLENIEPVERYIAPPDIIAQMAEGCLIRYNRAADLDAIEAQREEPVLSTMPMPLLMSIMGWQPRPEFITRKIWTVSYALADGTDINQTIYYPGLSEEYYRASIVGNRLLIEYSTEPPFNTSNNTTDRESVLDSFGIQSMAAQISSYKIHSQSNGKLLPIAEDERRRFMSYMTEKHNVYSLGRYATWRQVLLDDVVQDIERIETWIGADAYSQKLMG